MMCDAMPIDLHAVALLAAFVAAIPVGFILAMWMVLRGR